MSQNYRWKNKGGKKEGDIFKPSGHIYASILIVILPLKNVF